MWKNSIFPRLFLQKRIHEFVYPFCIGIFFYCCRCNFSYQLVNHQAPICQIPRNFLYPRRANARSSAGQQDASLHIPYGDALHIHRTGFPPRR